jgi:hypothetical protein
MVTNYIESKDQDKVSAASKTIKSFIKKTKEGAFCIYDQGFYINMIFHDAFFQDWITQVNKPDQNIDDLMNG